MAVQRAAAAASEIEQRRAQIKAAQKDAASFADEQGRMEKEILEIQKRRDKVSGFLSGANYSDNAIRNFRKAANSKH